MGYHFEPLQGLQSIWAFLLGLHPAETMVDVGGEMTYDWDHLWGVQY